MLVITRKDGESVLIGENIKITVVKSKGGQVKIGIEAPKEVVVTREELLEKNEKAKKSA